MKILRKTGAANRLVSDLRSLLACILLASATQQIQALTEEEQFVVDPQVVATRLRIYDQVIQSLAIDTARGIGPGVITNVPPLPFGQGKTTHQVVRLDVKTLQLNGFTFEEFYLPPGTRVSTAETQIILSYQRFVLSNAPINPPPGFDVVSPVARLTAFPMSALANAAARPLVLSAPAGAPITVTFLNPVTDAYCATFNTTGQIALITTQRSPARTICDATTIGTFTLSRIPAPPPGPAPAPAPSAAPLQPPVVLVPPPSTTPPAVLLPPGSPTTSPPSTPPSPPEASTTASSSTGLIVGLAVGLGVPLLILAAVGIWYAARAIARGRLEGMEKESDKRASLETAIVGGSRAPAAGALRTRPYLETEDIMSDRI